MISRKQCSIVECVQATGMMESWQGNPYSCGCHVSQQLLIMPK